MYATANGHIAKDGKKGNGVFTERLLKYMDTDLTIMEISIAIAKDLKENEQVCLIPIYQFSKPDRCCLSLMAFL
jgi:phospholipid N-methyltransferase